MCLHMPVVVLKSVDRLMDLEEQNLLYCALLPGIIMLP